MLTTEQNKPRPKINFARFKAALALRERTFSEVARASGRSLRHLLYVIAGSRPGSDRVFQALFDAVGASGWHFATGQTDTLRDEESDHAPA